MKRRELLLAGALPALGSALGSAHAATPTLRAPRLRDGDTLGQQPRPIPALDARNHFFHFQTGNCNGDDRAAGISCNSFCEHGG